MSHRVAILDLDILFPPNMSIRPAQYTISTLTSHDDTTLMIYQWLPSKKPKAHLVINHGYLEHARRYDEFARAMTDRQIAVTAFDVRGHGSSSGLRGYVGDFGEYVDDLKGVIDKKVTDKIPKFLLGHSNGGLISLEYVRRDPSGFKNNFNGLILSSPWLAPCKGEFPLYKMYGAKLMGVLYPTLSVATSSNLGAQFITHDVEQQKSLESDKTILSKASVGWVYQAMLTQKKVLNEVKQVPTPLLFAFAGSDKVSSPEANAMFGQAVQSPDKLYLERKGEYHNILSEINRKELFGIVADWILDHV